MEYGLIGEKLGHSFSKTIHGMIAPYDYTLKELSPSDLDGFMKKRGFRGINVTIPYKKAVIPYLDGLSPEAEAIGAVNTVVNKNGRLYGYNTDIIGLKMLIKRVLSLSKRDSLSGLDVLITGTGGTSMTARAAAESLGAKSITLVSRGGKDGAITYEQAEKLDNIGFIINCTPCGMFPNDRESPISLDTYENLVGLVDVIYNPLKTLLVRDAFLHGVPAEGGLYMLVAQAVAAYSFFFGKEVDDALTDTIFKKLLSEKENIVLIGMPSSGKTTVGKRLSEKLGRKFIDTDEEIVKAAGMPISEIFSKYGEKHFRDIESEVILRLSSGLNGTVIATGGGAVLREKNVSNLQANGRLFWLDRPLEMLMPTSDRPTASSREAIEKRFFERYEIYRSSCDVRVDSSRSVDEALWEILTFYA